MEKVFNFHELKGFFGQIATKVQKIKITKIRRVHCNSGILGYSYNYTDSFDTMDLQVDLENLHMNKLMIKEINNGISEEKIKDIKKIIKNNGLEGNKEINDFYNNINVMSKLN